MVDFQGVCLRRTIRYEKSAGGHLRGILQTIVGMLWNLINHIAMSLVRDAIYMPSWSFASKSSEQANENSTKEPEPLPTHTRESLSNILLTHIDFRRPILDSKRYNMTKHDETIEKVPESCIEEFVLYVSTWKGWHGPLPGKDNRLTWEQVERVNTVDGTASCTHVVEESDDEQENDTSTSTLEQSESIAESFSYSLSKIPKSNLMMVYVNRPKQKSSVCPKLIIKRKPVVFSRDEWCTRLKTTPYRERPHKCFFVHDGENRVLFPRCANSGRSLSSTWRILSFLLIFFVQHVSFD